MGFVRLALGGGAYTGPDPGRCPGRRSSSPFALPNTDGVHLDVTVFPAQVMKVTNTTTAVNGGQSTSTTGANNTVANPTLSTIIVPLNCPTGCNASAITGKFTGLPAAS